jgi:HNH endonuclease
MSNKPCVKCLVCKPVAEFYYIKRQKGHDTRCKSCVAVYMQTRKEHTANYSKRYHMRKVSEGWKSSAYRDRTDEQKANQYQHLKNWRERNKEKFNQEAKLGLRLRRSKAYLQHWQLVVERYGSQCLCCGATDVPLCFDHVVPLSMGGANDIANGQPLCRKCNTFKAHTDPQKDYRPDNGAVIAELVMGG